MSEPAQEAEPPAVLQTKHLKSGGDHHPLLAVVQGRHALEGLEPLMGVLATLGLVGRHATHGAPEDVRVRAEVEGPTAGLDAAPLLEEVEVLELVAVEVAAHVDALAPAADGGEGARWRADTWWVSPAWEALRVVNRHRINHEIKYAFRQGRYQDGKQQLAENHPSIDEGHLF